jgi:hypothetical protein
MRNEKGAKASINVFDIRTAPSFHFVHIAEAELCSTADFYTHPGGEAGAGGQRSYIVDGKENQSRETGRRSPSEGPGTNTAF